ncbi:MAG: hypothetical protein HYU77_13675 [Betaproteobacteria bacterium]|nr:hypothetical protein [Betaproteobacteria bacterium]
MARRPIHIEAAGKLTPRERVWAEIRRRREFALMEIEDHTRVEITTIRSYLEALERGGYITPVTGSHGSRKVRNPVGHFQAGRWRLVKDIGHQAPRVTAEGEPVTQGQANERMWRAMRILREFDYRELAYSAATEDSPIRPHTAKTYVIYLARAGYLQCVQPAKPGTPARHRLIPSKFSGPRAPMIQRVKQVYDPNLGVIVWAPRPEEVADARR